MKIKLYMNGIEFIDDVFGDDIKMELNEEQFSDYIFHEVTKIDKLEENNVTIYEVGSEELYAINNTYSLFEWYQNWTKLMKEVN